MSKPKRVVVPTVDRKVNGHHLYAEKYPHGWVVVCDSWADLAECYDGCHDLTPCVNEFVRRATAGGTELKESA